MRRATRQRKPSTRLRPGGHRQSGHRPNKTVHPKRITPQIQHQHSGHRLQNTTLLLRLRQQVTPRPTHRPQVHTLNRQQLRRPPHRQPLLPTPTLRKTPQRHGTQKRRRNKARRKGRITTLIPNTNQDKLQLRTHPTPLPLRRQNLLRNTKRRRPLRHKRHRGHVLQPRPNSKLHNQREPRTLQQVHT